MKECIIQPKKTTTDSFSIPALRQTTRGFGSQSSGGSSQAALNTPLGHDISRIPLHRPQTKLTVNQPGDIYEQQADRMAQEVVGRLAEPGNPSSIQRQQMPQEEELQMKPLASSITPVMQRQEIPEEEEEELQMKSLDTSTLQRESVPEEEEELQMKSPFAIQRSSQSEDMNLDEEEEEEDEDPDEGRTVAEVIIDIIDQAELAEEAQSLGVDAENYKSLIIDLTTQMIRDSLTSDQNYGGITYLQRPLEYSSCYPAADRLAELLRLNNQALNADIYNGQNQQDLAAFVNDLTDDIRASADDNVIYNIACSYHGFAIIIRNGQAEHLQAFANENSLLESVRGQRTYTIDNLCTHLTGMVAVQANTRKAAAAKMGFNHVGIGLGANVFPNIRFDWACYQMADGTELRDAIQQKVDDNRAVLQDRYPAANAARDRLIQQAMAQLNRGRRGRRREEARGAVVRGGGVREGRGGRGRGTRR
ncbi:hypothetical protein IQ276_023105 [Desmonostoc muscorum LEGE 12446]|uniref:Uncharacterized protein n=1 Tax=Desmonostoc muscorum LEGE 12446 TaxID=1828758 RepID=A0A8J6ZYW8_DESMC|nr:hypothetical protein [Desmonostoc muscorum]MCF2149263.1 hypothetical protein [Desmonostoc muscorum LEGE 12446]